MFGSVNLLKYIIKRIAYPRILLLHISVFSGPSRMSDMEKSKSSDSYSKPKQEASSTSKSLKSKIQHDVPKAEKTTGKSIPPKATFTDIGIDGILGEVRAPTTPKKKTDSASKESVDLVSDDTANQMLKDKELPLVDYLPRNYVIFRSRLIIDCCGL